MSSEVCSLMSFSYQDSYCSQSHYRRLHSVKSIQDAVLAINLILSRTCLCWHDVHEISFLYERIDRLEQEAKSETDLNYSYLAFLTKIQNKIKEILSVSISPPEDLINLYHLSHFSKIAPPPPELLTQKLLHIRRSKGGSFEPTILAAKLPYCVSEAYFAEDLKNLIGIVQDDAVKKIVDRPMKILQFDAKLRAERRAFLKSHGSGAYPAYLDELLEGGFFYLYEHLLKMIQCQNRQECDREGKKIDASTLSHILLEVRRAILEKVERSIPSDIANMVVLVGNAGSGKSTTLAFLAGEPLKRQDDHYELFASNLIGHHQIQSQTFLPNIKIIGKTAYVDFPGFNDTRGFVVNLGIELAFKALVSLYMPKIAIIESILVLQDSRGSHVSDLGQDLKRILGNSIDRCQLVLTRYLQMRTFGNLEVAQSQKRRLKKETEQLEQEIQKKEKSVFQTKREIEILIRHGRDSALQKLETLEEKIQQLEEEIHDLEIQETPLTSREERFLTSSRNKVQKKKEKLKTLQTENDAGRDLFGKLTLETQLRTESEELQAKKAELHNKLGEIALQEKEIETAKEAIKEAEKSLLKALGIEQLSDNFLRLDDLDKPETRTTCQQGLRKMIPVADTCQELSLENKTYLIQLLTSEFASKKLSPPKERGNIHALRNRIIETSLIDVLTSEFAPEIGQFLHLAEMDPECWKTMDKELKEQFIESFVRLIVVAPVLINDPTIPAMPIAELMNSFKAAFPLESSDRLQVKYDSLKKAVLLISRKGASTWEELEESCHFDFENLLIEARDNHLKEWDSWVRETFKIPIQLIQWAYRSRAQNSACQLVLNRASLLRAALLKKIEEFHESFQQLKDLEKIITDRDQIDEAWKASQSPKKVIDVARKIYNQETENGQSGPWEHRVEAMEVKIKKALYSFQDQVRRDDFLIDLMQLELIKRDRLSGEYFVFSASGLAKKINTQKAKKAFAQLSAVDLLRKTSKHLEIAFEFRRPENLLKQPEIRVIEEAIKKAIEAVRGLEKVEEAEIFSLLTAAYTIKEIRNKLEDALLSPFERKEMWCRLELEFYQRRMARLRIAALGFSLKEMTKEEAARRLALELMVEGNEKAKIEAVAVIALEMSMLEALRARIGSIISEIELDNVESERLVRLAHQEAFRVGKKLKKLEILEWTGLTRLAESAGFAAMEQSNDIMWKCHENGEKAAIGWRVLAEEKSKVAKAWDSLANAVITGDDQPIQDAIRSIEKERRDANKTLMEAVQWTVATTISEEKLWHLSKRTLLGQILFIGYQEVGHWQVWLPTEAENAAAALRKRAEMRKEKVQEWIDQMCLTDYRLKKSGQGERGYSLAEKLFDTIRQNNDKLAHFLELDLSIVLHRILLLAVLDKQRNLSSDLQEGNKSVEILEREESAASSFGLC